jgi:hypothetical protein
MALAGLGAGLAAPYVAGAMVLLALGLPLQHLSGHLAHEYWAALGQPAFLPWDTRIRIALAVGAAVPIVGWLALCWGLRARLRTPARTDGPFATVAPAEWRASGRGRIPLGRIGRTALGAPPGTSLLALGPYYPALLNTVVAPTLHDHAGPVLVVDTGGRAHAATAGRRRAAGHAVVHIAPCGGGAAWNPLARAWGPGGLDIHALRRLVSLWCPDLGRDDRFLASHIRNAFTALVGVADDLLRAAGESLAPTPTDVYLLLQELRAGQRSLDDLLAIPALSATTVQALNAWNSLDDVGKSHVVSRLLAALRIYAMQQAAASAEGPDLSAYSCSSASIYLDVPDDHRDAAAPLIAVMVDEWRARVQEATDAPLIIVHGLDLFPRLDWLTAEGLDTPVLATAHGLDRLQSLYGAHAALLHRRFDLCALHAPREAGYAKSQGAALERFAAAHAERGRATTGIAQPSDLVSLKDDQQILLAASLSKPVVCRTLKTPAPPDAAPALAVEGEPMPVRPSVVALLAAMSVVPSVTASAASASASTADAPVAVATIGKHRFAFPRNLYYTQNGPDADGGVMLVIQWPSLEAYPQGVRYRATNEDFINSIRIDLMDGSHLSEISFADTLNANIEPTSHQPPESENPARNMSLRKRGPQTYGLDVYQLDHSDYRAFRAKYFPDRPLPDVTQFPDWYVLRQKTGDLKTVITCDSRESRDGVHLSGNRIVDNVGEMRRSLCQHRFLIHDLRLIVTVDYLRILLPHWKQIEDNIREKIEGSRIK